MSDDSWNEKLKNVLEDFVLLENCKRETIENFGQFYEFIAEPAFDSLRRELRPYRIKASYRRANKGAAELSLNFPRSGVDNFHYLLILPRNAVEMRLKLVLRGRKTPQTGLEEREEIFMPDLSPAQILKLDKETLLLDVISKYQEFNYRARTSPD